MNHNAQLPLNILNDDTYEEGVEYFKLNIYNDAEMTNVVAQTGTITINDTSRYIIFVRSGFSFNPTSFNLIALQFPQIIPQIAIGERNYFNK